jgi:L-ascorbate metabolism protein UlaG (beta-lactamase superfamily)
MTKQFGGKLTSSLKEQYSNSKNWKNGAFQNLEKTSMEFGFQDLPKMLCKQFFDRSGRFPLSPIPINPFDKKAFLEPSEEPKFIWYGHSVLLMRWMNKTMLIDPMLGPNASPIGPIKTKRFSDHTLDLIDQFPEIDLLLMTHDHYDHLDKASFDRLKSKTKQWFTALGVGRHLESWGISNSDIQEFDWWDGCEFEGIQFTFTPSRHFSGRGLNDRAKSLWGGWIMKTTKHNLYWSGDGGYGEHFKEIGEKYGPFDFGFMECGQYNELWHQIHMYPEEAAQAAMDAGVKKALPVHWGGFPLAMHHWKDPINRFEAKAQSMGLEIATPEIGQLISIDTTTESWWHNHE